VASIDFDLYRYLLIDPTDGTIWLYDHEKREVEACGDRLLDVDQFAERRLAAEANKLLGAEILEDDDDSHLDDDEI